MKRFVEGEARQQVVLLPPCLDDYVTENNPVRVIEAFVDELDLVTLGFDGVVPEVTGRPAYHPSSLLKLYLYGCLNRVQSSRWLEREAQRNVEVMWLTGRLAPDFKTIADFRKDVRFGTLKAWMGATHFLTRTIKRVSTEMSLHVLAYNLKRVIAILGVGPLMAAIRA
jgi:transposase